jgi:hypothetical protein
MDAPQRPTHQVAGRDGVVVWRVLTILARTDEIVRPAKSAHNPTKVPTLLSWQRGFSTRKTTTPSRPVATPAPLLNLIHEPILPYSLHSFDAIAQREATRHQQ